MAVLLIGPEVLSEMTVLADAVRSRGSEPLLKSVLDWPGETLVFTPGSDDAVLGSSFEYDDVEGVFVHVHALFRTKGVSRFDGFEIEENVQRGLTRLKEHRSVFESLWRTFESRGIPVLPGSPNGYLDQHKPWQLEQFERNGVPVPDTVITNDPQTVESFCEERERVIYKPVATSAAPAEVSEEDLEKSRLERLAASPVLFQEFVPGDDLRVYVLDGEVVGATRYESEQFSFKLDQLDGKQVEPEPATVSDEVAEIALRAADAVDLTFGAADVRRRPDGGHALLELNQTPAFAAADTYADQRVADAIADYLTDDRESSRTDHGN